MKSKVQLFNGVMVALCALGAVACNNTPTPKPTPSNGIGGGSGGISGGGTPGTGSSSGGVYTQHNDGYRTGQNLNETILTRTNVNPSSFGKIGALPVDGQVYAQPLEADKVNVNGTDHDIVYVATENDSVYAFDADSLSATPIWKRSLLGDKEYTCPNGGTCTVLTPNDTNAPNIGPTIGVTSTPVIDPVASVIYVVGVIKDSKGLIYWMLHSYDLATGKDMPGSPVTIEGSLPGEGYGTDAQTDAQIHFDANSQLQRAGLVLNNGLVYVAFASWNDQEPAHGWLFSYDAASLEPVSAFITTPNTGLGTIWQGGGAPAVDENGDLYFSTGNSDPGTSADLGDSVLKVNFDDQGFDLVDYFTPYNYSSLNTGDVELSSGGPMLIPDQLGPTPHMLVEAGKAGTVYLLNRDNMGKLNTAPGATSDPQIIQELPLLLTNGKTGQDFGTGVYGLPAYYQSKVFYTAANDSLRSIPLENGQLSQSGMSVSSIPIITRGATPSVSADGNANGIVWYIDAGAYTYSLNGSNPNPVTTTDGPAVLYAFSTDNLGAPLYASSPTPISYGCGSAPCTSSGSYTDTQSKPAGNAVKYVVPTIINGKVFVGTDTEVSVYGLRSTQLAQNTQRVNDESLERSVASFLAPPAQAESKARMSRPFDFWSLKSRAHSCGYRAVGDAYLTSLY